MKVLGVKELRDNLSEAIDLVEGGETVEVTRHGRVVARVVPVQQPTTVAERRLAIASLDELAERMAAAWNTNRTAQEAIDDVRS